MEIDKPTVVFHLNEEKKTEKEEKKEIIRYVVRERKLTVKLRQLIDFNGSHFEPPVFIIN